ncbi:DNA alkylation repair protein [Candidatus Desantisbacteria bacterium CG_4_10_14_0_8_um_filter_48_22]|uniref:DNA alkylation repair protein n=1 Tax=Candidatus Desantisbacteria bacterium CG_4_10_14_0_8_um_filter_48_22 TaxID=1974543 RepID=A0A2M7S580_9BACT|nr:MAG: DNA alkylation repair protein [Candidatus Desantisbacteria bacterium CG02_land_8_20_14_3_00_49_13]PIZ14706.1 MAG: DNA alkylation repair protein [Candidatus Desantisbacteria bacterium CG_4_10_14_0_8_um_filter_48_22]PJB28841.1 MAG: DNA alkylation repair protein [Candidatus Desantisbacteria bacterium CG_4_9_14_3_um_filter_50_7]
MKYEEAIAKLRSLACPENLPGMARYGIDVKRALGIQIFKLRDLAKKAGKDHELALRLWDSGIHEARMLASLVDEPAEVTEKQIEEWVKDFDSWDICDQVVHLFEVTPFVYKKIYEWSRRKEEFVKRSAFSLIAAIACHDKKAENGTFLKFLPVIKRESTDERNYVRKAVNWALRGIGKRNLKLNKEALKTAREIQKIDSKAARWIASDAIRELSDPKTLNRLNKKTKK